MYEEKDLKEIRLNLGSALYSFHDSRFLLTGVTGFIGSWLLDSLIFFKKYHIPELKIAVVVRDNQKIDLQSDIEVVQISNISSFGRTFSPTHIIHGANPTNTFDGNWILEENTILKMTTILVEIASNSHSKLIHLSSGAVYGQEIRKKRSPIDHDQKVAMVNDLSQYGNLKSKVEELIEVGSTTGKMVGINARLFSFYGPGLDLGRSYAISQFVNIASQGLDICIEGSPNTVRSLMYPTDLITNLLTLAMTDIPGVSTIGSKVDLTILDIARLVGKIWGVGIKLKGNESTSPNYYFPNNSSIFENVELSDGLLRWKSWLDSN